MVLMLVALMKRKLPRWRSMIDYVQQHYHQRVTLAQIAAAGCVGRTQCAVLFHDMGWGSRRLSL